jgi:hypothetical protein
MKDVFGNIASPASFMSRSENLLRMISGFQWSCQVYWVENYVVEKGENIARGQCQKVQWLYFTNVPDKLKCFAL